MSANKFYSSVESTARLHEFPDVKIEHVKNKEGGLLSASLNIFKSGIRIWYSKFVLCNLVRIFAILPRCMKPKEL